MDALEDKSTSIQVPSLYNYSVMWYILGKAGFFL